MASEKALQDRLLKTLREYSGVTVMKIVGGTFQEPGYSDIILSWHGLFVAIELKQPGRFPDGRVVFAPDFKPKDRREEMQKRFQEKVLADGGIAFFSDNYKATVEYLERIML